MGFIKIHFFLLVAQIFEIVFFLLMKIVFQQFLNLLAVIQSQRLDKCINSNYL